MHNQYHISDDIYSIEFYRALTERMLNAFALHEIVLDSYGNPCDYEYISVNPSFENFTGLRKEDTIGKRVTEIIPEIRKDSIDWIDIYGRVAINEESVSFNAYSESLGKWYIVSAFSPKKYYFITIFNDISDIKLNELDLQRKHKELLAAQETLHHVAFHDYLTGLPNAASLLNEVKVYLEGAPDPQIALLYIDTDNFKYINRALGHSIGKSLIKEIGTRITSLRSSNHNAYSLGGDEFVFIIYGYNDEDEVKECATRIIQSVLDPLDLSGSVLYTTVSIGIALFPAHGTSIEELLKNADIAVNMAKNQGKNQFAIYNHDMSNGITQRLIMEKHLHTALENHEFEIYYQPQLDLQTKEIRGFEALLRWHSPELGSVSPLVFIEIAEYNHLIIPIGKWVLRNACYFIKKLQNRGYTNLSVAVNVSVLQLMQEDFVESVLTQLELLNLDAKYLELELTESMMIKSYEHIYKKLNTLREHGIRIALDDFGKGYSSLSGLNNLPIDTLKIDKVFIDSILDRDENTCITDMIINLGQKMGLSVLAEGVETQDQMDYLTDNKCHIMQGFLYSKPIPEDEIVNMLGGNSNNGANTKGFEWKQEYSINIGIIDEDHKEIFKIGNRLTRMVFTEETLGTNDDIIGLVRELIDYTHYHFKHEEELMLTHEYPYVESHKKKHKLFIDKILRLNDELNNYVERDYLLELIDLVAVWITIHILKEDKNFSDFLSHRLL